MNITAEILGVPQALAALKLKDERIRPRLLKAVDRGCLIITNRAKEIIGTIVWTTTSGLYRGAKEYYPPGATVVGHIQTGTLRRSVQYKTGWVSESVIDGVIGTDTPYAPYVEALPDGGFLFPAMMQTAQEAFDTIAKEMKEAIVG